MRKYVAGFLTLVLLTLLLPAAASAAGTERAHINYITDVFNENNGLPTGDANAIVQDRSGYLWIGSYGGLIRFDGSTFTVFSDRLESSAIRSLFESSDGTLYIGTNDAGVYRMCDDVFTRLTAPDDRSFLCVRDF